MNILTRIIVWFWTHTNRPVQTISAEHADAAWRRSRNKKEGHLTLAERVVNAEILIRIAQKAQPGSFTHTACMEALCLTPQQIIMQVSPEALNALEEWEIPALLAEDRPTVN